MFLKLILPNTKPAFTSYHTAILYTDMRRWATCKQTSESQDSVNNLLIQKLSQNAKSNWCCEIDGVV